MADTAVTPLTAVTVAATTGTAVLPIGTRRYTMTSSAATALFHGTNASNPGFPLDPVVQWGPFGTHNMGGATLHFSGTGTVNILAEVF